MGAIHNLKPRFVSPGRENGDWIKLETVKTFSFRNGGLWRAACILGLMASCGITRWEHPVKGIGGLQQDLAACEARARQGALEGDPHTGNVLSVQDHIDECLQARGYIKRSGE